MESTKHFVFDFLGYTHLHKEIITNRNFALLDSLLWNNVLNSRSISVPPQLNDVQQGDLYLVPAKNTSNTNHSDKWSGYEGHIACCIAITDKEAEWHFIEARQGMMFLIRDESIFSFFHQYKWHDLKLNPQG